ncbi:hypothetical protein P5706_10510 [Pseudomonas sp. ChxA]|uniref:hypothetical protein n=1 Tax=Pseudomonas sp. ChxA TaxID=3035473 RepID=UPI002557B549|nr:hypothetical protein [Pseudomonas sp. ChxA]MDL2184620.1 hypothetical protein [Pseudomonas sp. ChxA]
MNIAKLNLSTLSTPVHVAPLTAPTVNSTGGKWPDVVNAFNAPQRRFGEDYDASAHTAVIKMMMVTFGQRPADLFAQVKRAGQGYEVTLRDGNKVQVSDLELRQTAARSRLVGNDTAAISDANFALAVFVKRKQLLGAEAGNSQAFEPVLSTSLRGETTYNVLQGLGMAGLLRQIPAAQLASSGGVGVMETHTFGAGLVYEGVSHEYGRKRPVDRPYVYVLVNNKASVDVPSKTPDLKVSSQPQRPSGPGVQPVLDSTSDSAVRATGQTPVDIVRSFDVAERRFGEGDSRRHASVIKMMMMRFGQSPQDVFDKVVPAAEGYDITMKDGFSLHLSKEELRRTAGVSRFAASDNAAVMDANFMLAAYVKRVQLSSTDADTHRHFDAVLSGVMLNDTVYRILKGMGMIGFLRIVEPEKMQVKGAVAVVDSFAGELVLDGIKYQSGKQEPVVKDYGYMLAMYTPDTASAERDSNISNLSNRPVGAKPENIWSGFYQGSELNCVTVSAIKAAMMKYGQNPQGIFKRITETPEGYTVTMRDSCTVHLTYAELEKAKKGSHFFGEDKGLLLDAIFCFAVSAKRAQMENHEFRAAASIEAAIGTLNDKETPGEALRRLGLYAFTRGSTAQELASGVPGTLANHGHSVGVFDGIIDFYGAKMKLAGSDWEKGAHALKLV